MSMEDAYIFEQLQTAVIAAVEASDYPTLPIKAMGRNFDPREHEKYLEIRIIPNNRNGDFWGNEKNYQGILRLILHWQNDNMGIYTPVRTIRSICSYFSKDKIINGVQIYENPNLLDILEEGDELLYPVSIRYRSYRPAL